MRRKAWILCTAVWITVVLAGCSSKNSELNESLQSSSDEETIQWEIEETISPDEEIEEAAVEEDTEESERLPHDVYVDFSVIEENHEILEYDICAEPRYDWENTLLGEEERLREMAEDHKAYAERLNSIGVYDSLDLALEYFLFDFNDDGLEDYLICLSDWEYSGSGGNSVSIYVQEEGGTLKEVLSINDRLHQGDGIHERFTVLNEKTDGYYAIVLTSNHILRYDSDTGWYEFHEGE